MKKQFRIYMPYREIEGVIRAVNETKSTDIKLECVAMLEANSLYNVKQMAQNKIDDMNYELWNPTNPCRNLSIGDFVRSMEKDIFYIYWGERGEFSMFYPVYEHLNIIKELGFAESGEGILGEERFVHGPRIGNTIINNGK